MVRNSKTGQVTSAEPTAQGYAQIAQAMKEAHAMGATAQDAGGTNTLSRMAQYGYDSNGDRHSGLF